MTKNGARKGRAAEREVAKICQEWWSRLDLNCEFRRTPLSGGWLGKDGANVRAHFKACGDIMTTSETWPFTVEVKRREFWNVHRLFSGKPSPVWGWWRQAIVQAREEGGIPMLWARKNQYRPGQPAFPWFIMLPDSYYVDKRRIIPKPDVIWNPIVLYANQVDFAGVFPSLWFADRLMAINPKRLIMRKRRK